MAEACEAGNYAAEATNAQSNTEHGPAAADADPVRKIVVHDMVKPLAISLLFAIVVSLIWFALGKSGDERTWMAEFGYHDRPLLYTYTTCLHWAICQFTVASPEVVPTNMRERTFAVLVPLMAVLVLYPFLWNSMVRLSWWWAQPRGAMADTGKLRGATVLRQAAPLLFIIIVLVLFTALGWFALGESGYEETWMIRQNIQYQDIWSKFLMSLHWAVCQFTFASMEVFPANTSERIYASLVPLLATVTLQPFVAGVVIWLSRWKACPWPCSVH